MSRKYTDGSTYDLAIQSIKDGLTIKAASELHNIKEKTLGSHLKTIGIRNVHEYRRLHNSMKLKVIKSRTPEVSPEDAKLCMFCRLPEEREAELGKFHVKRKVSVHYYCLLFSCALEQNGEDDEGILGFLQRDILREIQRGRKLKCIYCLKTGATIGCNSKCKASFHFPCGLKHNAQYVFNGDFSSFCREHREYQIKIDIAKSDCPICLDPVARDPKVSIYPPCCKRAWFHRICLQKLALSAGYFFKCPLCNDKSIFVKDILKFGVYVPETDASWEKEPNAYADLLERPIHCDAPKCGCSGGRNLDENRTIWEIILCCLCGSTGTHLRCAKLQLKDSKWECSQCREMLRRNKRSPSSKKTKSKVRKFNESFYPRKKKRVSNENLMGESSGLSQQLPYESIVDQEDKHTLPTIDEMNQFANNIPAILLDSKLQQYLKDIVPNCHLNIFGSTIDHFCKSALREIQMLILYQIYKPFSLWLDLKITDSNVGMEIGDDTPYNFTKMENLAKLIEERIMDATNSSIMEEFKVLDHCNEEKSSNEVIRYGNNLLPLKNVNELSQKMLYSLIKDCSVIIKPLSRLEIEQKISYSSSPDINNSFTSHCSTDVNTITNYLFKKSHMLNLCTNDNIEKENKTLLLPISSKSKLTTKAPLSMPLGEKCLNASKPMLSFSNFHPKTPQSFKRKYHKPKDSKKYIQLSISDFFLKK